MHRPVDTVTEVDLISETTPLTSDHKTRFGKPVSEPNLAEDIKGKVFYNNHFTITIPVINLLQY